MLHATQSALLGGWALFSPRPPPRLSSWWPPAPLPSRLKRGADRASHPISLAQPQDQQRRPGESSLSAPIIGPERMDRAMRRTARASDHRGPRTLPAFDFWLRLRKGARK